MGSRGRVAIFFYFVVPIFILILSFQAHAFFDDLCFSGGALVNCITADPTCNLSSEGDANCLSQASASFQANTENLGSRSLVHADAINLIAQAVGLEAHVAYFLAAYGDAPDHSQFIYFERQNDGSFAAPPSDGVYSTIPLNGLSRDNVVSGGYLLHFPLVYSRPAKSTVDPTDTIHEGISRLRAWALQGPALAPCVGNLANLDSTLGSYFTAATCYISDPSQATSYPGGYLINGSVDLGSAKSGNQMMQTDSPGPAKFAGDLQGLLNASPGRLSDGSLVPESIVRMGIYLHTLTDRISHKLCVEGSSLQPPAPGGTSFTKAADPTDCGASLHAYRHYEEVGLAQISPRTNEALEIAYDELALFAQQNPNLNGANAKITAKDVVVQALITLVLNQPVALTRLQQMAKVTYGLGYMPMRLPPPSKPKNLTITKASP